MQNFVDLAGSERAAQTHADGTRLKEGCHINLSLMTLTTVIRKLRSVIVVFRKLIKLLVLLSLCSAIRTNYLLRFLLLLLMISTFLIIICSVGKRSGHIPYRDSKLTRILQHSLGGNARTAIICTLSPALTHVEQSRNTLYFATRAKEVTNNAQVNMVITKKS